jgi:hypothetical protein
MKQDMLKADRKVLGWSDDQDDQDDESFTDKRGSIYDQVVVPIMSDEKNKKVYNNGAISIIDNKNPQAIVG